MKKCLYIFIALLFFFPNIYAQYQDNLVFISSFRPNITGVIHILDVQIIGDRAYCCGYGGVSIFDISNISSVQHLGNYNPLRTNDGTFYHRMVVNGTTVYVIRRDGGIDVIDFSNETNPIYKNTYSYNTSTCYENVLLDGTMLYSAVHTKGVEVIDVSDPVNPQHVRFISANNAFAAAKSGNYLFIADIEDGLVVIDSVDTAHPQTVKKVKTTGGAQFIDINGNYAYVAVGASGFDIFDITTKSNPVFVKNYPGLGFCHHLVAQNNKVYMAEWDIAEIVDVSNPSIPLLLAKEDTKSQSMGINAYNDLVFVADWSHVRVYRYYAQPVPDLHPDRRFLSFGDINSGTPEELTVTISNIGEENLIITDISSEHLSVSATPHSFTISPGERRQVIVSFSPSSTTAIKTFIIITSNDPDQPTYNLPIYAGSEDFGPGDIAPDFVLYDAYNSKTYRLSDLRGKLIVFTVFASW